VNGFVDDKLRALLRIPVAASGDVERTDVVAWSEPSAGNQPCAEKCFVKFIAHSDIA
jgi:hypothetical protein